MTKIKPAKCFFFVNVDFSFTVFVFYFFKRMIKTLVSNVKFDR